MSNTVYNKVTVDGDTLIDISDTTAVASDVMAGKYFYGNDGVKTLGTGSGGVDLSWLVSSTPTPSVRNFFYALANGTCEHGEFTLTSTPNNAFVDLFTMTNITSPQGIMFIDKNFYQGVSGLQHQSSEAFALAWADKSFTTPAADATNKYLLFASSVNQTATAAGTAAGIGFLIMDGTTQTRRAYWQWNGKTLQVKFNYNNNNQYTAFLRNRPYIWIVW